MLEVLPIQDKQEQEALCGRCGIPFRVEALAYKAIVDGTTDILFCAGPSAEQKQYAIDQGVELV